MIRRKVQFAAALALALTGTVQAEDPPFTRLFDGKTLTGWVPEHTDRISVRDGVIVIDGGTGWLRLTRSYKNFQFEAEYRALKKGADSGLLFRSLPDSTPNEPHWPTRGYQLQIIDADSNLKIFGHGTAPPTSDRKTEELKKAMKGPGEWQRVTLTVVGKHAEASLNGLLVTTTDAITLTEGFLGLQGENGQFEWRELRIRELPP